MNRAEFNQFCAELPATTYVEQWGNASVWKVGGKIFALCSQWGANEDRISFKCGDIAWDVLRDMPGIGPAPYLGRAKWVQVAPDALDDDDLRQQIHAAHQIITGKLTKAKRAELGL